jgi:enamine deaminase RidA (YjgF/YER057c/UK114 family)
VRGDLLGAAEHGDRNRPGGPALDLPQSLHNPDTRAVERERRTVPALSPFAEAMGYARVVRIGPHAYVSGTAPIMPDDADPPPDAYGQTRRCLQIALSALAEVGVLVDHVVRTRVMVTRAEDFPEIARAHGEFFRDVLPVSTGYVVAALLDPRWLVEIELEALVPE